MAAATCLSLLANVLENVALTLVVPWVEQHITSQDWHYREAAVMAFGSILDGPNPTTISGLLEFSLPHFIGMMQDSNVQVKDTTAWTLGRICEVLSLTNIKAEQLRPLAGALVQGLSDDRKVAANCAWCIINLAEYTSDDPENASTYKLSEYFPHLIKALLESVEPGRPGSTDANVRATVYEAVAALVGSCAKDCYPVVTELAAEMVKRLQATIAMQHELVNADDRTSLQELQGNICSVLTNIIRRMGKEASPFADQIMLTLLHVLTAASRSSTVIEDSFIVVSALAGAAEQDFVRYMPEFHPHLKNALQNPQESQLSAIAIGLVGDICRALSEGVRPYADDFMNLLVLNLQSPLLDQNAKPTILSTFGDIAIAVGGEFEASLPQVMLILNEVITKISAMAKSEEQADYANLMREGILEAFVGIVQGLHAGGKAHLLQPYVGPMFGFMEGVMQDEEHYETLEAGMAGLLGDVADAFPEGALQPLYAQPWVDTLLKSLKAQFARYPNAKLQDVMKWLRVGVKKQKIVR
ncbi:karyopherin beta [Cladochytrium tenue]|nr:karyopherin beta [Cladochytrium tenue]